MLKLFVSGALFFAAYLSAAAQYWQQQAKYTMDIVMDVKKHQFTGSQTLVYTNNSPDTLTQVFYHLYFNAFQPGSAMDVRSRTISDPDRRVGDRISKLKPNEIGYQKINALSQNNIPLQYQVEGTILEVKLAEPILPGKTVTFTMQFEGQVPVQIRRSGRDSFEKVAYSMTQWYPKLAEYDVEGWHADPYIGREFYGVWADFDVKITIDKNYVLGGTGYVQNPQEVGHGYQDMNVPLVPNNQKTITWHFKAPMVHDFAWAADPFYKHDVIKTPGLPDLHFLYKTDTLAHFWEKLKPYAVKLFEDMNARFGKYPYDQFSIIQGGDGGMEYPMATLITCRGSFEGLVSVTAHEAIHNWFYGVLATNESKYPWMDEGFTTYATDWVVDRLLNQQSKDPQDGNMQSYISLVNSGKMEPLTTHADHYQTNRTYGISSYSAGAAFLHQLSYIIGMEAFDRGMLRYFETWKFKHPTPNDFIRVMEKESGLELSWYLDLFTGTLQKIDYSIETVDKKGKTYEVTLKRVGEFPMPLDVAVVFEDGSFELYYIPLDLMRGEKKMDLNGATRTLKDWTWTHPTYTFPIEDKRAVKTIVIDPTGRMADCKLGNNIWKAQP